MKVINYVSEENDNLFDINTMRQILGTSRSRVQREIKRNGFERSYTKYKNQHLYPEEVLLSIMEKILIEKLEKEL